MTRQKVLVVEDDLELRNLLSEVLAESYDVFATPDLAEGARIAEEQLPDVALLDIRLPGGSGLDLCRTLRDNPVTSHIKVIILTGQVDSDTVVKAFNYGADDYICKPFRMTELNSRLDAKFRRVREKATLPKEFGNLSLVRDQLLIKVGGDERRLSPLEFSLLEFLIGAGEKIASRKAILRKVWAGSFVSDRTVDAHIVGLRKKLARFDYEIVTVYGAGYALKKRSVAAQAGVALFNVVSTDA